MARKAERIAAELRRRIVEGELRPGQALPAAKELMAEWGGSMGPAYRALTMLRHDGLAERAPAGRGLVVAEQAATAAESPGPPPPEEAAIRAGLVRAAIAVADREGLAALSMRRVAMECGQPSVWLLTYVRDRDRLVALMSDSVFAAHPPPAHPAGDRRARLESVCRLQWAMYRRHPWLAVAVSFHRPHGTPHVAAHTDWAVAAVTGAGSGDTGAAAATGPMIAATAANFVRGSALNLAPTPAGDDAFEAGLQRLLDGFALDG
ncbi:winged helix-turn-helix transcriptional regulator [Dactylosporangium vinaceum]|uniref:Winged helix-turn-helix domain-containing protein n=1 Tax=Dactylosporangium vinaceum TaxID=53362 RepID=A0ABV5MS51_9ACTN|nr:winged helix-turn-helix domain-containing protein [Dactylosporangium vinaceum]UAC00250.1 winged helix-turn-helix transcriptional regulator [Dactylosporangium vinaceum]